VEPVSQFPPIETTIYSYECDPFGHLNQAAYLQVFERARWEILTRGPGADLFDRNRVWPAVRRATVDYLLPAFPGDVLKVDAEVEKVGGTSLEMRQRAVRVKDGKLLAELHIVFVMIDAEGRPRQLPEEIAAIFRPRHSEQGALTRLGAGDVSLAAEVRGDGPALLLIHGFPLDHSLWAHQIATLKGWRRIAPDLRGLGVSEAPADGYSMAAYTDDLVSLLDQLEVEKAVVAGLSMGGYVAFELLRRHRRRVLGLILVDTRAEADTAEGRATRETLMELARREGPGAVGDRMLPRLLGRTSQLTQPHLVPQVKQMVSRWSVPGIVGALGAMRDRPDSTSLLQTIDVPTLVVVGEEDELAPPALSRAMTSAIPSAAMTTIAAAGHLAPLEAPSAVSRVMAEFLEAVPRP
jgi:3-oxoadipate enol-lactonase